MDEQKIPSTQAKTTKALAIKMAPKLELNYGKQLLPKVIQFSKPVKSTTLTSRYSYNWSSFQYKVFSFTLSLLRPQRKLDEK